MFYVSNFHFVLFGGMAFASEYEKTTLASVWIDIHEHMNNKSHELEYGRMVPCKTMNVIDIYHKVSKELSFI